MSTYFYYRVLLPESEWHNRIPTMSNAIQAEGMYMPDTYLHGRPVYYGQTHLAGSDSHFESAYWVDTGIDLDDNELDELGEQEADYLVTQNLEHFGYFMK